MVIAAAGIAAAGSVAGAAISSSASGSAAEAQTASSLAALRSQNAQWAYNAQLEQPYISNGINAQQAQLGLLNNYGNSVEPYLNQLGGAVPGEMTQANLESTPGYQFTLSQGLKSTQNAAAARGLGVSGAALKGAATYATGLSDQTYNTRFNQQQTQYSDRLANFNAATQNFDNQFNAYGSQATLGGNVAVQAGTQGQAASNNSSNLLTGIGNAQAAGTIGSANALSSGLNGLSNAAQGYAQNQQLQAYLNGNGSQYGGGFGDNSTQQAS